MTLVRNFISLNDFGNICRVCLEEKPNSVNFNSIMEFQYQNINIASVPIVDILRRLTTTGAFNDLKINLICPECINEIKIAYLFVLKLEEANKMIEEFLKVDLKSTVVGESSSQLVSSDSENHDVSPFSFPDSVQNGRQLTRRKKPVSPILHTCPICNKEFTNVQLRIHATTHKVFRKYLNIPLKEKVSANAKFSTTRHMDEKTQCLSIFTREDIKHQCPHCYEKYAGKEFGFHVKQHRKTIVYQCDQCPRAFRYLNHLSNHRLTHLETFPFTCQHCQKGFVIKENYDCHVLTHSNEELPHRCPVCLRRFSNPRHLMRHQLIHTENITYERKYRVCRCNSCRKTFQDKSQLQNHECLPLKNVTYARKKWICKICDAIWPSYHALYQHNRIVHKLNPRGGLCSVCGLDVKSLHTHMLRHSAEKRFKCDQCNKRFFVKANLNQHLLVHSGQKPYVCSGCGKSFNNLRNLEVHERIHRGDRCHICQICGKGFLERTYLNKHLIKHSKET